jgi:hypothetical protein
LVSRNHFCYSFRQLLAEDADTNSSAITLGESKFNVELILEYPMLAGSEKRECNKSLPP